MDNSNEFYLINTKEYLNLELHPGVNKDNLKKSQLIMTEMLRSFDKICRKYNLKYWCIGGTFIGIIRHNGWVSHDGDIDICMLDIDYEILCSKVNELSSNLWLQSVKTDSLYNILLPKIRHLHSYYSDYASSKSHQGLQIDIYVYKQISDDLISLSYNSSIPNSINCCYPDAFNMKYNEIFPLSEGKFEGINVYIPNNYKDFSIRYWGNYPPVLLPIKKRYPHEGKMNPNNAREADLELYPNIYNSLKEWRILIISINNPNSHVLSLIQTFNKLNICVEVINTESSHKKAWEHVANSNEDSNYIILEDSVDIPSDFNFEYLTNLFKYLPVYDYVNLSSPCLNKEKACIYNNFFSKYFVHDNFSSYTISKDFANKLKNIKDNDVSLDSILNNNNLQLDKSYITLKDYFISVKKNDHRYI